MRRSKKNARPRRTSNMTRDEARRIAANIACRRCWSGRSFERLNCEPTDHCGGCPHIGRGHTEFLRSYCFGRSADCRGPNEPSREGAGFRRIGQAGPPHHLALPMPWVVSSDVFCRKRDRPPKTESLTRNQTGPFLCLTGRNGLPGRGTADQDFGHVSRSLRGPNYLMPSSPTRKVALSPHRFPRLCRFSD